VLNSVEISRALSKNKENIHENSSRLGYYVESSGK